MEKKIIESPKKLGRKGLKCLEMNENPRNNMHNLKDMVRAYLR